MRVFFFVSYLIVLFLLPACGSGVGIESPTRPIENSAQASTCLKREATLVHLRQALDQQKLRAFGPVLEQTLFEQGALKTISRLMLAMVRRVDTETLTQTLVNYESGEGLARLSPAAIAVLTYAQADRSQTTADNYAFFNTLGQFMERCSAHDAVTLFRTALAVTYENENGEKQNWLDVFLDKLAQVMTDPGLPALLDRIEFQENTEAASETGTPNDNAEISLGRDAFVLLTDLILGNLASPDIDVDYFRTTMEELLFPQISDEGTLKSNIIELLDVTFYALNADPFLLPYLQSNTQCLQTTDTNKTLGHFAYDLLTLGVVNVEETVNHVRALQEDPSGEALLEVVTIILEILYLDQGLSRDLFLSTSAFLAQENLQAMVPQIIGLQGSGLIADLSGLLQFFFESCQSVEPPQ